jgi:hypothetical protein
MCFPTNCHFGAGSSMIISERRGWMMKKYAATLFFNLSQSGTAAYLYGASKSLLRHVQ